MNPETRNAALAALIIMLVFGVGAYFIPTLVIAAGNWSPYAGSAVAAIFVLAFFAVFWLRARHKRHRED